jgi:hypothetical protein
MADDRDRRRETDDGDPGDTSVSNVVKDVADPDRASGSEERDEGPEVSDEEGLP